MWATSSGALEQVSKAVTTCLGSRVRVQARQGNAPPDHLLLPVLHHHFHQLLLGKDLPTTGSAQEPCCTVDCSRASSQQSWSGLARPSLRHATSAMQLTCKTKIVCSTCKSKRF